MQSDTGKLPLVGVLSKACKRAWMPGAGPALIALAFTLGILMGSDRILSLPIPRLTAVKLADAADQSPCNWRPPEEAERESAQLARRSGPVAGTRATSTPPEGLPSPDAASPDTPASPVDEDSSDPVIHKASSPGTVPNNASPASPTTGDASSDATGRAARVQGPDVAQHAQHVALPPVAAASIAAMAAAELAPGRAQDLPPRPDARCEGSGKDLYWCREGVARKLAEQACVELERNPPNPPHARVPLRLSLLTELGHKHAAGGIVPDTIDIAVEPTNDFASSNITLNGIGERSTLHTMLTALERGAAAGPGGPTTALLDIGANLGTYSMVAAAFGFSVRAFEAMPRNVQALHQTLCWNPELRARLTVFPYALTDKDTRCAVVASADNVSDGRLACSQEQLAQYEAEEFVHRGVAHAVRLGDYLGETRSDVLRLDVDGLAPLVMRAAGKALTRIQTAATKIHGEAMARKSNTKWEAAVREYLAPWERRRFSLHICKQHDTTPCMDMPRTTVDAVIAEGPHKLIELVMQKPPPDA
eukprot:jgi/Ulvmu1/9444/UM052_0008.1